MHRCGCLVLKLSELQKMMTVVLFIFSLPQWWWDNLYQKSMHVVHSQPSITCTFLRIKTENEYRVHILQSTRVKCKLFFPHFSWYTVMKKKVNPLFHIRTNKFKQFLSNCNNTILQRNSSEMDFKQWQFVCIQDFNYIFEISFFSNTRT